jgi:hypothetical protein
MPPAARGLAGRKLPNDLRAIVPNANATANAMQTKRHTEITATHVFDQYCL